MPSSHQTHQHHHHPHVRLRDTFLPLQPYPTILRVTFDPTFTFNRHIQNMLFRARKRTKILRALAGTTWGQQKETLVLTYNALIWSVISYAAPVWFPITSPANIQGHKRADIDHLHAEAKELPVTDSLGLPCAQYLASARRPTHPMYRIANRPR